MSATLGRRIDGGLQPARVTHVFDAHTDYVIGRKPQRFGDLLLQPGDPCPIELIQALPRPESFFQQGLIVPASLARSAPSPVVTPPPSVPPVVEPGQQVDGGVQTLPNPLQTPMQMMTPAFVAPPAAPTTNAAQHINPTVAADNDEARLIAMAQAKKQAALAATGMMKTDAELAAEAAVAPQTVETNPPSTEGVEETLEQLGDEDPPDDE